MTQSTDDRLDRLGEPATIAAEARVAEGLSAEPPQPSPARAAAEPPNRWLSRPLPPTAVVIIVMLTLIAVTIMVLGYIMATREAPPVR